MKGFVKVLDSRAVQKFYLVKTYNKFLFISEITWQRTLNSSLFDKGLVREVCRGLPLILKINTLKEQTNCIPYSYYKYVQLYVPYSYYRSCTSRYYRLLVMMKLGVRNTAINDSSGSIMHRNWSAKYCRYVSRSGVGGVRGLCQVEYFSQSMPPAPSVIIKSSSIPDKVQLSSPPRLPLALSLSLTLVSLFITN